MRVMSAGDGYQYLLKTVAAGDGDRDLSTPLTRYYAEAGTPPGYWLGEGVRSLEQGELGPGDLVSEAKLQLLVGTGRDPMTGDPLGRAYPVYKSREESIADRIGELDAGLSIDDRAAAVTAIEAEEAGNTSRRAIAACDYTFSVPKSVSVLWGLADAGTQSLIATAHHQAVAEVVALMEREVAATRTEVSAGDGAVAQIDVTGLIATGYDHYGSRAGDPQLHTHVVVSNKVRTVYDDGWRSLDGRPMRAAVHALSAHCNAVLVDHLIRTLGVEWEQRAGGRDRTPAWDIVRVSDGLIEEFSSRSRDINAVTDQLIAHHVSEHGRRQSGETIVKLRAQATLSTRPEKEVRSLAELTAEWRQRAGASLGVDAASWVSAILRESEGGGETVNVAALEPPRSGLPGDYGVAVRQHRGAGSGCGHDRRRRRVCIPALDAAGARQLTGRVPTPRRYEPVQAEELGHLLLGGTVGGRRSAAQPVTQEDLADGRCR